MNKFMGVDGFYWWQGVVEDRMDPLKCGRCRVRVLGVHTDDKSNKGIPTEHLPWATLLIPANQEERIVPPKEGSWVMGFFRDGAACQDPVIMGVIPGIPTEANPNADKKKEEKLGFFDPADNLGDRPVDMESGFKMQNSGGPSDTEFIRNSEDTNRIAYPKRIGEPDTHRLARNDSDFDPKSSTILKWKIQNRLSNVPVNTTDSDSMVTSSAWSEPDPSTVYGAVYPYNKVMASESGHVIEVDDTPNYERIHTFHRSGTFDEMQPSGDRVMKTIGDSYRITYGDDHYVCFGTKHETFGGNKSNHYYGQMGQIVGDKKYTYALGTNTNVTAGSFQNYVGSSYYLTTEGNDGGDDANAINVLAEKGNVRITSRNNGAGELHLKSDYEIKLDSNERFQIISQKNISTQAMNNQNHSATGNFKINTGGVFMAHSTVHAEIQGVTSAAVNSNMLTSVSSNAMTKVDGAVTSIVGGLLLLNCLPPIIVPILPQPAMVVSPAKSADHVNSGDENIPTPSSLNVV